MEILGKYQNLDYDSKQKIRAFLSKRYKSQNEVIAKMKTLGFSLKSIISPNQDPEWTPFNEMPLRYIKAFCGYGKENLNSVEVLATFHDKEILQDGISLNYKEAEINIKQNESPYKHHIEENMVGTVNVSRYDEE